jgi:hypothetical protein
MSLDSSAIATSAGDITSLTSVSTLSDQPINNTASDSRVDEKWNDEKADLHLLSSDGVLFKVPRFYIQTARYVPARSPMYRLIGV